AACTDGSASNSVAVGARVGGLAGLIPYSQNSVPCASPFLPGSFILPLVLPSISSQLTSSIGGGTTRTKWARLTASKPLPPREVTSYFARPNSISLPPEVSKTNLSNRPPISAPPRQVSPSESLIPITPLPTPD